MAKRNGAADRSAPSLPVAAVAAGRWEVGSATTPGKTYTVVAEEAGLRCSCEAGSRGRWCAHVRAVRAWQAEQERQASLALEQSVLFDLDAVAPSKEQPEAARTTKHGYIFGEVASALQKAIRAGDEEGAVWWAVEIAETSPWYVLKRLLVIACEDVGPADLDAVRTAHLVLLGWVQARSHSYYLSHHAFALAALVLARAAKSTEAEDALSLTLERMKRGVRRPVPPEALDAHTAAGRAAGKTWTDWYAQRLAFGIPANRYTRELAKLAPEWFDPELRALLQAGDDAPQARNDADE